MFQLPEGGCPRDDVSHCIKVQPIDAGYCYCRRSSAAPALAWLTVPVHGSAASKTTWRSSPQELKNTVLFWACSVILLLGGCGSGSGGSTFAPPPSERMTFAGVGAHGIFDPSITQDPGNGRLWMSYSAVDPSVSWPAQNYDVVATRLAYSDDNGGTWNDSGFAVNDFLDVTLPLAAPNDAGTWVNEVSQLIHDPGAVATERWKLLWHHYLLIDGSRRFEHGWIAMKVASTPEGLAAAPEMKLFAGYLYDSSNDTAGGTSGSPVGGAPLIRLDTALDPALNTCVFTEPGTYASSGALYVSLQCEHLADSDRLIVLLKCASPCNAGSAVSWSYLGTVLRRSDAIALGFDSGFAASGMFTSGAGVYLVVTPVQTGGMLFPDYYSGCRVFRFENIDTALLRKTGSQPALTGSVDGTPGSFNGACSFHALATGSGMLYSELNTSVTERFQIFMSHTHF